MTNQTVTLTQTEWQQVLYVLYNGEGRGINAALTQPLMIRIGDQLRAQPEAPPKDEDWQVRARQQVTGKQTNSGAETPQ